MSPEFCLRYQSCDLEFGTSVLPYLPLPLETFIIAIVSGLSIPLGVSLWFYQELTIENSSNIAVYSTKY